MHEENFISTHSPTIAKEIGEGGEHNFLISNAKKNNSDEQMRFGLDLIQQINLKNGHRVLDIGCGTGRLTEVLARGVGLEGQVVAIDPKLSDLLLPGKNTVLPINIYLENTMTLSSQTLFFTGSKIRKPFFIKL